jgi:type II secretory pathway pseudopilin PulG
MQPQQPSPNYDFIMNPGQAPKPQRFGGGSMASRLLLIAGGLFVLVIIVGIVLKLLTGGGGSVNKAAMLSIAQDQTELIRLAQRGSQDSVSQANKNFSVTLDLGMQSEQTALFNYLSKNGVSFKPNELSLKQSANADQQLNSAKSSSTFDQVYEGIMERQLQAYQRDLQSAYQGAGPNAKKVLSANYDASELFLTQLKED